MGMKHLEDMIKLVIQRITDKEKPNKPISAYEIAKRLSNMGIKITQNGVLGYSKEEVESMRWPVMAGLQILGDLKDKEVMDFVRRSLPKTKK